MKRNFRGMSLLEISVVLAIAGVLTTLAVASLGSLRVQAESAGTVRFLLTRLRNARTMSLVMGIRHGIYIGGPTDSVNNGSNNRPNLKNQLVAFRKPGVGSTSTVFDGTVDRIPNGDQYDLGLLRLSLLKNQPNGSVSVVFDENGKPFVSLNASGGSSILPFPNNGTGTLFLGFQREQGQAPNRCLALEAGGEVRLTTKKTCDCVIDTGQDCT